jgi:hypothetical protein
VLGVELGYRIRGSLSSTAALLSSSSESYSLITCKGNLPAIPEPQQIRHSKLNLHSDTLGVMRLATLYILAECLRGKRSRRQLLNHSLVSPKPLNTIFSDLLKSCRSQLILAIERRRVFNRRASGDKSNAFRRWASGCMASMP